MSDTTIATLRAMLANLGLGVSIETTTSLVYDFLAKCDTSHL